jgi:hypothetical protein
MHHNWTGQPKIVQSSLIYTVIYPYGGRGRAAMQQSVRCDKEHLHVI